jgi:hypothetical protein
MIDKFGDGNGHGGAWTRLEKRAERAAARAIAEGYPDTVPLQMHLLIEAKTNFGFSKRAGKMQSEINGLKVQLARRERSLEKANDYIKSLKEKARTIQGEYDHFLESIGGVSPG